jgi:tetratricopeptide (TPR) repeat protein
MALAHRKGLLRTERDISLLSTLYSNADVPYKSAQVFQSGIEIGVVESTGSNWARVAAEWYAAQELGRALAAFELAGNESEGGAIDLRRGFILADLERWSEAQNALDAAIEKGGLEERQLGDAYLMRGMVQFNLGNFDAAGADWDLASQYESTRIAAEQWMAHLREEQRRQAH